MAGRESDENAESLLGATTGGIFVTTMAKPPPPLSSMDPQQQYSGSFIIPTTSVTAVLVRSNGHEGSASKPKEKFVTIFEPFFRVGHEEWPPIHISAFLSAERAKKEEESFWDDLFMLKVNGTFLERGFASATNDQLRLHLRFNINLLFRRCILSLKDDNMTRTQHAAEIIYTIFKSLFARKYVDFSVDIVNIIASVETIDQLFAEFVSTLQTILTRPSGTTQCKRLIIDIILQLVLATTNINQNSLLEYFVTESIFDILVHLLVDPQTRSHAVYDVIFILATLMNYKKYEKPNSFIERAKTFTDRQPLENLMCTVSDVLSECNRRYRLATMQKTTGFMSMVSEFFSNLMETKHETNTGHIDTNYLGAILLGVYELTLHSQTFKEVLICYHPPPVVSATIDGETVGYACTLGEEKKLVNSVNTKDNKFSARTIGVLLTFCSHIFQDVLDHHTHQYANICFIILACLCEDENVNKMLHEPSLACYVHLHRKNKEIYEKDKQLLVAHLIDILIEFMKANLKKKLPIDLYMYAWLFCYFAYNYRKSINVLHRILSYQTMKTIQLNYKWNSLWETLFRVLKHILNDETINREITTLELYRKITIIFNLFITFGDTAFLKNPAEYDMLYYELIHHGKIVDDLYTIVETCSGDKGVVLRYLENMKLIVRHFTSRLNQVSHINPVSVSSEQVLEIIRNNYSTLKLKLLPNLEVYDAYLENPQESSFFRTYLRTLVTDVRQLKQ